MPGRTRLAVAACLILLGFATTYRLGTPPLLDDPNDAQYAEVAREMVVSGDWISPRLDEVPFLNKPPLLYWLIAASYGVFGVDEAAARLPGVVIMLLTVVLVHLLGRELFDRETGALAALLYGALPSTLLEARFVRPDALLIAGMIAAVLAFVRAARSAGAARRRALYGFQVAVAAGLMAKGMPGVLLPAIPIAFAVFAERRWDLLRMLLAPRSWLLFVLLVTPWHAIVSLRHPGFAWDYVVNQHLLFFLDLKEPRDSIPISLGGFWLAFLLRNLPWTPLIPAAVVWAGLRARDPVGGRSYRMLLVWGAGILVFFSAATSRLEHYALPAVPVTTLLVAALLRAGAERRDAWRTCIAGHLALLAVACAVAVWLVPRILADVGWLSGRAELPGIARFVFAVLAAGAAAAAAGLWRGSIASAGLPAVAVLLLFPRIHAGLVAIAPVNSTQPLAAVLRGTPGFAESTIVYEAPMEYQTCAGLNFYLRRKVTLLRPPGFVDPPYLAPYSGELFIDRDELEALWRREAVLFVSDPLQPTARAPSDLVPAPFRIVARTHDRWVLSNLAGR